MGNLIKCKRMGVNKLGVKALLRKFRCRAPSRTFALAADAKQVNVITDHIGQIGQHRLLGEGCETDTPTAAGMVPKKVIDALHMLVRLFDSSRVL